MNTLTKTPTEPLDDFEQMLETAEVVETEPRHRRTSTRLRTVLTVGLWMPLVCVLAIIVVLFAVAVFISQYWIQMAYAVGLIGNFFVYGM